MGSKNPDQKRSGACAGDRKRSCITAPGRGATEDFRLAAPSENLSEDENYRSFNSRRRAKGESRREAFRERVAFAFGFRRTADQPAGVSSAA